MTQEEETVLKTLETRVRQLMLAYKDLQQENGRLQATVASQQEALNAARQTEATLREDFARLKMARMMDIGDGDLQQAKRRVDKLVHKIDKCIALLNV